MQVSPQRRRWLMIGVGTVILAIAIAVAAILLIHRRDTTPTIAGVESFSGLDRTHTSSPVTYPQTPPVGGPHNAVWQNCGYYNAPIANENGVHSLEHGAVWITYRPDLPADQLGTLRKLTGARRMSSSALTLTCLRPSWRRRGGSS